MKARIITMVAAAFLALGACKPEVGSIGPSYEAGAGILGTWELTMVEQTDVTLPVPETRDVSDLYLDAQNKWVVAFNSDSTYSVNQQGPGFDVFGNGGTWRYNTPGYPSELHLTQDSSVVILPLGNMPRSIDQNVSFIFARERCDKPSVSYQLTFTRK